MSVFLEDLEAQATKLDKDVLRTLIESGLKDGTTNASLLLCQAIKKKDSDLEFITYLCDNGADVNACDSSYHSDSALLLAVSYGHFELVKFFVENHNGDVNAPLFTAVGKGHIDIVKYLVAQGADVSTLKYYHGETLIHAAAKNGHLDILELLVEEYGVSVDVSSKHDKITPLHYAAENGYADIVEYLIEHGANPNSKDRWDKTPIMRAASENIMRNNREEEKRGVVELLIRKFNADVDLKDHIMNDFLCREIRKRRYVREFFCPVTSEGDFKLAALLIAKGDGAKEILQRSLFE